MTRNEQPPEAAPAPAGHGGTGTRLGSMIEKLDGKWVLPILIALEAGAHRPVELSQQIDGMSDKARHSTLDRMLERGLLERRPHPGVPPRVEYTLTHAGREALKVARSLDPTVNQELAVDPRDATSDERYLPGEHAQGSWQRERIVSADVPSTARMYDYYLGGKDNFEADRVAAEQVLAVYPEISKTARANRSFLVRAVHCLADLGVDQYIDLGTGIPTSPNVHEIAQRIRPNARVIYVDNDPVVITHNRALRETHEGVISIDMDVREIDAIRRHPDVRELIDFDQPIAVLLVSMLHFFDDRDARKILEGARSWMTPGSYLVLSTGTTEGLSREKLRELDEIYKSSGARAVSRSREEIAAMFDGFELLPPGLTSIAKWRADEPDLHAKLLGGIGYRTTGADQDSDRTTGRPGSRRRSVPPPSR